MIDRLITKPVASCALGKHIKSSCIFLPSSPPSSAFPSSFCSSIPGRPLLFSDTGLRRRLSNHVLNNIRMASTLTLPNLPIFDSISRHDPSSIVAAHCLSGRTFRYGELLPDVCRLRDQIQDAAPKSDLRGERIAFLVENSYDYVGMSLSRLFNFPSLSVHKSRRGISGIFLLT